MTVHFVYIKGDSISTPAAITNEVAARLALRYPLKVYDWAERITIHPEPGDVLIGHPHTDSDTVFAKSFYERGWSRRIVFCPHHHGMPEYNAFLDSLVNEADIFLAICGKYWYDTNNESVFSHWTYKTIHCDLAVNRENFPELKTTFNPEGRRRFLYIGHNMPYKGTDFLCRLADANPNLTIGWVGLGEMPSRRIVKHGYQKFSEPAGRAILQEYDFLLTCGRSDANPTTILEAASWGLIPVATLQSGYYEDDWLVNVPLDDVAKASQVLNRLNNCSDSELCARRESGFRQLADHYNWDRLSRQVADAIELTVPNRPLNAEWDARKARNQLTLTRILRRTRRNEAIQYWCRLPRRAWNKAIRITGLQS